MSFDVKMQADGSRTAFVSNEERNARPIFLVAVMLNLVLLDA
jgi:hypothetical protein